jgi:hypothetical protein
MRILPARDATVRPLASADGATESEGRLWPAALPTLPLALIPAAGATAGGGYFPSSWGWAALGFGWLAALGLCFRDAQLRQGRVALAALAAFAGWTFLSTAWASSVTDAVSAGERVLVLVFALFAFLVVVRPRTLEAVFVVLVLGAALVCAYALATRLFPDRFPPTEAVGYRLSRPIGYWNALGIYAVIALAVSLGLIAQAERRVRVILAAVVPILAVTAYFTFSRGAGIAFVLSLAVTFVLDRHRMRWFARSLFIGVIAAVGVIAASRSDALTTAGLDVARTAGEGHRLALLIAALCIASAAEAIVPHRAFVLPYRKERHAAALVAVVAVLSIGYGAYRVGGPVAIVHSFEASAPPGGGDLNKRLLSISGNSRTRLWSLAWHEYETHKVLGGGAGSYERYYLQHRDEGGKVRNAHSLYLETLAELGPIGLSLLLVALLAPLAVVRRARSNPLVPALAGAYVAFLVHMGADWDWQLTAVAVCGLFCGLGIVVAAHDDRVPAPMSSRARRWLLSVVVIGLAAAFVMLVGNLWLARATSAARTGDWAVSARDAKRAHTWAPWSSAPWRVLGEAQLGLGERRAAITSFHRAIAKSPQDWNLRFDLARATLGSAQRDALDQAAAFNPLSPEVIELRRELAAQKDITIGLPGPGSGVK